MTLLLHIDNFAYAYPGSDRLVIRNASLTMRPGECHCITGPTGSGKSTLLMAIRNLLPENGKMRGAIQVNGRKDRQDVGMLLQNPESQILTRSLGAEVAFGLENACVRPEEMAPRVRSALAETGLLHPLGLRPENLSMGQKYRLILAAHLVMNPRLLLLDEPSAQLDTAGLEKLKDILAHLKTAGIGILICEHRPSALAPLIDHYWHLDASGTMKSAAGPSMDPDIIPSSPVNFSDERIVAEAEDLNMEYDDRAVWSDAAFTIPSGRVTVVYGENGSGKTTLLRCLTGFVKPASGRLRVFDKKPSPAVLRGRAGILFQNPSKQLFENTVFDEVAFSLKRAAEKQVKQKTIRSLTRCGIADLANRSPHTLSFGQKHLVALAAVTAANPELLLLDDPFAGLDATYTVKICDVLFRLSRQNDTAIVLACHQQAGAEFFDRRLYIKGGHIATQQPL